MSPRQLASLILSAVVMVSAASCNDDRPPKKPLDASIKRDTGGGPSPTDGGTDGPRDGGGDAGDARRDGADGAGGDGAADGAGDSSGDSGPGDIPVDQPAADAAEG
jgi:hypothetical protein